MTLENGITAEISELEKKPILFPLNRLLYSRKVLVGALAFLVSVLGYYGLPEVIVDTFNTMALAIIASWTAKDVATNFSNGKK